MAYFECKCGDLLHEDELPKGHIWQLLSESQIEEIMEEPEFQRTKRVTLATVLSKSGQLIRCLNCERIWLFPDSMSSGILPIEMWYIGVDNRQISDQEVNP